MLVLVIMLSLPFFQPGMYNDDLSSSAQYGINVLYRRWRDDMNTYEPYANSTAETAYLSSKNREVYVDDFFLYAYYHSPFTQEDWKLGLGLLGLSFFWSGNDSGLKNELITMKTSFSLDDLEISHRTWSLAVQWVLLWAASTVCFLLVSIRSDTQRGWVVCEALFSDGPCFVKGCLMIDGMQAYPQYRTIVSWGS